MTFCHGYSTTIGMQSDTSSASIADMATFFDVRAQPVIRSKCKVNVAAEIEEALFDFIENNAKFPKCDVSIQK